MTVIWKRPKAASSPAAVLFHGGTEEAQNISMHGHDGQTVSESEMSI